VGNSQCLAENRNFLPAYCLLFLTHAVAASSSSSCTITGRYRKVGHYALMRSTFKIHFHSYIGIMLTIKPTSLAFFKSIGLMAEFVFNLSQSINQVLSQTENVHSTLAK